jgi:thymidylate synthase ThyX
MVPVAIFIDNLSIWLAYYVWTLCPTAGGQESSTRYIKISADGLVPPEQLGIPDECAAEWNGLMDECFHAYLEAVALWESLAAAKPDLMGIPLSLSGDMSEGAQKKVTRMKRNYAFDRSRYFLPVAAATNMMMIMSARGWVNLCQHLLSHFLPEANRLGKMIHDELTLTAPRMVKYARIVPSIGNGILQDFGRLSAGAKSKTSSWVLQESHCEASATPLLEVLMPDGVTDADFATDLAFHDNRYAWMGSSLSRTAVRFGWAAVSFAEIRDLNRHRTGSKECPQIPLGFYCATEKLPESVTECGANLGRLARIGSRASKKAYELLASGKGWYPYWTLLGTQYSFQHLTTADKFIYEAELRTGTGAHFRYAKHLRDILDLWYVRFPNTRGLVLEGSAEPE